MNLSRAPQKRIHIVFFSWAFFEFFFVYSCFPLWFCRFVKKTLTWIFFTWFLGPLLSLSFVCTVEYRLHQFLLFSDLMFFPKVSWGFHCLCASCSLRLLERVRATPWTLFTLRSSMRRSSWFTSRSRCVSALLKLIWGSSAGPIEAYLGISIWPLQHNSGAGVRCWRSFIGSS